MKEFGQSSLKTLSLKDCHIANVLDNLVLDGLFLSSFEHQTFNEIAKEYQKKFHPNSAIEIKSISSEDEESEETVCYKASLLMEAGDYKAAYWMMRPLYDTAQNIEYFYNFSLCLSHLDVDDTVVLHTYGQVIKKYLECADLKDLEKIDGNIKQSDLDKSTRDLINKGVLIEDEEGVVSTPPPQTEEEIQCMIDAHNSMRNIIRESQKYDMEDLKQEAVLNSLEIQYSSELDSIKTSLDELLSKMSDKAISQINKWRNLIDSGEITEEEWESGFINDILLKDIDDSLDDKSISEQFDSLLTKKLALEKIIETIRDERHKLHTKHYEKIDKLFSDKK